MHAPQPARFKLLFATNNLHKIQEVRQILGTSWEVLTLAEAGIEADLPETGDTLLANAIQKANHIHTEYGLDCFSEDTGLEVDALGGAPGVYTARYAGLPPDSQANMARLLKEMEGLTDRRARFHTVIALWWEGKQYTFEGEVRGRIATQPQGDGGFGYDPVFIPEGYDQTFAALAPEVKKDISHRAKAVARLIQFLQQLPPA